MTLVFTAIDYLKDTEEHKKQLVPPSSPPVYLWLLTQVFWSWIAQAAAEASLITFAPLFLLKGGPRDFGTEQSLFMFGATTFTLVVLLANSKVCSVWCACIVKLSL